MSGLRNINILPGVNVLAVLPHLNYKSWFALAEFVDNSIQSAQQNDRRLKKLHGEDYVLTVDINFDKTNNRIIIVDNAAGISEADYPRAFRPAEIPPDSTGLSEFGMGMKSAACWFAPSWSVRTSALDERIERTVYFDIEKIVSDQLSELDIQETLIGNDSHYTEITLEQLRRFPRGKTITKIKAHLTCIYRVFINERRLILRVDGQELKYVEPKILNAPYYADKDGEKKLWKKEINLDLGDGKCATGFVAIREKGSTKFAGLSIFRRKRLIVGSDEETYRPYEIFQTPNSHRFQRIFGDIHLKGFQVSHTKDGIKWNDMEESFLEKLKKELSDHNFNLYKQAREYRTEKPENNDQAPLDEILRDLFPDTNTDLSLVEPKSSEADEPHPSNEGNLGQEVDSNQDDFDNEDSSGYVKEFQVSYRGQDWRTIITIGHLSPQSSWLEITDKPSISDPEPRKVHISLNLNHPFLLKHIDATGLSLPLIVRMASALGLAEVVATESPNIHPGTVRLIANNILKDHLS